MWMTDLDIALGALLVVVLLWPVGCRVADRVRNLPRP